MPEISNAAPAAPEARESGQPRPGSARSLYWLKTTNPDVRIADFATGTDARVLLPQEARFQPLRDRLTERGIAVREVRYWLEREVVTNLAGGGGAGDLTSHTAVSHLAYSGAR